MPTPLLITLIFALCAGAVSLLALYVFSDRQLIRGRCSTCLLPFRGDSKFCSGCGQQLLTEIVVKDMLMKHTEDLPQTSPTTVGTVTQRLSHRRKGERMIDAYNRLIKSS